MSGAALLGAVEVASLLSYIKESIRVTVTSFVINKGSHAFMDFTARKIIFPLLPFIFAINTRK